MKDRSWLLSVVFLVASAATLAMIYGWWAGVTHSFPHSILENAEAARQAWAPVLRGTSLPSLHQGWVDAAPAVRVDRRPEDPELVLIGGGPFQRLDRCPRFGCIAWLVDRRGEIRHAWEADLDELWGGLSGFEGAPDPRTLYPAGHVLLAGGDLIVTFQGDNIFPYTVGIARLDRDGKVLWKKMEYAHHWPAADTRGHIFAPWARVVASPLLIPGTMERIECRESGQKVYSDHVVELSPEGSVIRELSIVAAFSASGYGGLFQDKCDPTHFNSIQVATASIAARSPGVVEGDLLISLRTPSVIALLDARSGNVKRLIAGRTIEQHSPKFLPDGRILVFDNKGGTRDQTGGSRILRFDLVTGESDLIFPKKPGDKLFSATAGHLDVSADGRRVLVSVSDQSVVYEVDVESGEILWELRNIQPIAKGAFEAAGFNWDERGSAQFRTMGAYYAGVPKWLGGASGR